MFVGGVQKLAIGMDRQKRRAGGLGGQRERGRLAGGRLETERINALAASQRVGADVNEVVASASGGGGCAEHEQEESRQCADES